MFSKHGRKENATFNIHLTPEKVQLMLCDSAITASALTQASWMTQLHVCITSCSYVAWNVAESRRSEIKAHDASLKQNNFLNLNPVVAKL